MLTGHWGNQTPDRFAFLKIIKELVYRVEKHRYKVGVFAESEEAYQAFKQSLEYAIAQIVGRRYQAFKQSVVMPLCKKALLYH